MTRSTLVLATGLLMALGADADESGAPNDWSQIMRLEEGQRIWIRTGDRSMNELFVVNVTDSAICAVSVSKLEASRTTKEEVVPRCASADRGAMIVRGEPVDLDRLCLCFDRDDVLEVHRLIRGAPTKSVLIGAGVVLALFFYPCGVAPQANGSARACRVGTAGWGALAGLSVHYMRKGKRTPIYVAGSNPEANNLIVTWQGETAEKLKNKIFGNRE